MPVYLVQSADDQALADDAVMHFVTMTEQEFRDLLRSVADEARRERERR